MEDDTRQDDEARDVLALGDGGDASAPADVDASRGDHDDGGGEDRVERPAGLRGRLKVPDDTRGQYVVLWAPKPARGHRAQYEEVACVPAHDPDHAKKIVLEEDGRSPKPVADRGDVARWLLERAGEKTGILLRAVPAMHWPAGVETTSFVRPEPILRIG